MNPLAKKFISLFLVFALMMLSVNLYAKERRGAKLIITKKDGGQIEGELITVKPNSLLLLDVEGKDESIDIEDIKVIRILKKSRVMKGALEGLLSGVAIVVLTDVVLVLTTDIEMEETLSVVLLAGGIMAAFGALLGAIIGALFKESNKIQIEGMTDSEILNTLDSLRKKARIQDYK